MVITGECPHDDGDLLFDHEDLAVDIALILQGSSHAPDVLARLFITFKKAIDSGLHGVHQTSRALLTAVELTYLYSPAHDAALKLYLLSQQGELKLEDEPVNLINAAISRSVASLQPKALARKTRR